VLKSVSASTDLDLSSYLKAIPDARMRVADSGLLPAAGGGARDPEPLPEPAGSGAIWHPPPRRIHRGFRP